MFHLIQHVESYEDISVVREFVNIHRLRYFPVHHTFVSYTLFAEYGSEFSIYFSQYVPDVDESLFQFGNLVDGEILEELA